MSASILVAYATNYGSTEDVAKAVGATLSERGFEVSVRPAREVDDLQGSAAVVLGAPLYFMRWHKDARHFMSRHKEALQGVPVAVFALGPMENKPEQFEGARKQLDKVLTRYEWLKPAAIEIFGGRLDPARLHFPHSNPGVKKMPPSDIRDWDAIRIWAEALPAALGL